MSRKSIKPEIVPEDFMGFRKTHPSFGTIIVTKQRCAEMNMFGSEIQHDTVFHISVNKAESSEHNVLKKAQIVSFYMTPAHFAEMVGSIGVGEGTPITFDHYPIDYTLELAPYIDVSGDLKERLKSDIKNKFENSFKKLYTACEQLSKLSASKTISKKEFDEKIRSLQIQISNLSSNLSFYTEVAEEQIEDSLHSAKAQIETFSQIKRNEIVNALSALKQYTPTDLIENKDTDDNLE